MNKPDATLPQSLDTWTDLSGFGQLRASAEHDSKAALPAVARQFEAIFTQMMLKSMRQADFGDPMFESQAGNAYRDLYDQQLSLSLASHGRGIGIAQMLIRQLGGTSTATAPTHATPPPSTGDNNDAPHHGHGMLGTTLHALGTLLDGAVPTATESFNTATHSLAGDPAAFVRTLAPHAEAAARTLGVSIRAVLAQAALETGWGRHMPARGDGRSSYNLFGIKAGQTWDGQRVNVPTLEYENGVAVRKHDSFRAYDSAGEAFDDYTRLLSGSPRYSPALNQGNDVAGFAQALVHAGYASDPAYAAKLTAIADSQTMRKALAALKNPPHAPLQDKP